MFNTAMRIPVLVSMLLGVGAGAASHPPKPRPAWSAEKQAVHVLNRLAYGPSPADLGWVERLGPSAWIELQLHPEQINDAAVDQQLSAFHTLTEDTATLMREYPPPQKLAKAMGVDMKDEADRRAFNQMLSPEQRPAYVGMELAGARLVRATESKKQLQEVLVDFWFNHFNVSGDKGPVRWMLTSYERDAIRPHVFGKFRELLGAVAHHPAMLFYLDNWLSTRPGFEPPLRFRLLHAKAAKNAPTGINENYARELMELHTLGVDGGYTQQDVHEVARCFTGWTLDKPRVDAAPVFRPARHDDGSKTVLGTAITAGGERDGEEVLDLLARSPHTAHFIAKKLCQKFVADDPPEALVQHVAKVFLDTDGDLRSVYRAIFSSREFWSDGAYEAKTKTPLELAVSSLRALSGETNGHPALYRAIAQMGEPLYRAQPPTGYPEIGAPWINAGALVSRINFEFALVNGRVQGAQVTLPQVTQTNPRQAVQELALDVLHTPLSQKTLDTVVRALQAPKDTAPADGEQPRFDTARAVALLLGSPEFQQQ